MPLVSVVMPIYNAERYVAATMRSVLAQSYADFEFIIVNDGSKDASESILREFSRRDGRIRLISRANTGIVRALNEGLEAARGRYIARIDADDLCHPRRFEIQVARMQAEPDLVALGSNSLLIDERDRRLGHYRVPLSHEEIESAHLRGSSSIHHPAVMLRRSAVMAVGGYRDLCPAEDLDLWLRLGEVGRVANVSESLLIRRMTTDGLVATKESLQAPIIRRIVQDAWQRRRLEGKPAIPARPTVTPAGRFCQWGWLALEGGHRGSAFHCARRAIIKQPRKVEAWKLLLCAVRGH